MVVCTGARVYEQVPDALRCPSCKNPAENTQRISPCNHGFCERCAERMTICVVCRQPAQFRHVDQNAAYYVSQYTSTARVRCTTCQWTGFNRDFANHQRVGAAPAQHQAPTPPYQIQTAQGARPVYGSYGYTQQTAQQPVYAYAAQAQQQQQQYQQRPGQQPAFYIAPQQPQQQAPQQQAQQPQQASEGVNRSATQQLMQQLNVGNRPGSAAAAAGDDDPTVDIDSLRKIWGTPDPKGAGGSQEQPGGRVRQPTGSTVVDEPRAEPSGSKLGDDANTVNRIMSITRADAQDLPGPDHRQIVEEACRRATSDAEAVEKARHGISRMLRFTSSRLVSGNPQSRAEQWDPSSRQHGSPSYTTSDGRPTMDTPAQKAAAEAADAEALQIYWDLDNVPIPTDSSARLMYQAIVDFFVKKRIIQSRSDVYAHVYFVDANTGHGNSHHRNDDIAISSKDKEALRAMGCVLVACTKRKEDADRQIAAALGQLTSFKAKNPVAIISSDKDFSVHVQRLRKHGNQVYVLHDARRDSEHEQILAFSASTAWRMHDVMRGWWNSNNRQNPRHAVNQAPQQQQHASPGSSAAASTTQSLLSQLKIAGHDTCTSPPPSQAHSNDPIGKLLQMVGGAKKASPPPQAAVSAPPAGAAGDNSVVNMLSRAVSARSGASPPPAAAQAAPAIPPPNAGTAATAGSASGTDVAKIRACVAKQQLVSQKIDGAPAVLVNGARIFSKFLEKNECLDELIEGIGQQGLMGVLCPDGAACNKGRSCTFAHFKLLRVSKSNALPTWALAQNMGLRRTLDMLTGLAQLSEMPRFCTEHPFGHGGKEADHNCRNLHYRFVTIGNDTQVPAYILRYNNALFEVLRGKTGVEFVNGPHASDDCDETSKKAVAVRVRFGNRDNSARLFTHSEGLRAAIIENKPGKICGGHRKTAPASEYASCNCLHPKRILLKEGERDAIGFIEEPALFATLDAPREVQAASVVCDSNHSPDAKCPKLHLRKTGWPTVRM